MVESTERTITGLQLLELVDVMTAGNLTVRGTSNDSLGEDQTIYIGQTAGDIELKTTCGLIVDFSWIAVACGDSMRAAHGYSEENIDGLTMDTEEGFCICELHGATLVDQLGRELSEEAKASALSEVIAATGDIWRHVVVNSLPTYAQFCKNTGYEDVWSTDDL
ncbi:hypothetical protein [Marinobacterium jannaschii]|uniref:hypothetical protein n=1 Tax=Marinobacterium jannaschii TaxID=64970 RepID=UPI0004898289|nr:hypothetical protein [Marinobacterium jannaschii]